MTEPDFPELPAPLQLPALIQRLAEAQGWENKNRALVQLAREMPALPDALRDDAHRVIGCEARVWLYAKWQDESDRPRLSIWVDSDSRIVKGLLALVWAAYAGRNAEDVRQFDFAALLQELGLSRFLSSSRVNGLTAIVNALRQAANVIPT